MKKMDLAAKRTVWRGTFNALGEAKRSNDVVLGANRSNGLVIAIKLSNDSKPCQKDREKRAPAALQGCLTLKRTHPPRTIP